MRFEKIKKYKIKNKHETKLMINQKNKFKISYKIRKTKNINNYTNQIFINHWLAKKIKIKIQL